MIQNCGATVFVEYERKSKPFFVPARIRCARKPAKANLIPFEFTLVGTHSLRNYESALQRESSKERKAVLRQDSASRPALLFRSSISTVQCAVKHRGPCTSARTASPILEDAGAVLYREIIHGAIPTLLAAKVSGVFRISVSQILGVLWIGAKGTAPARECRPRGDHRFWRNTILDPVHYCREHVEMIK